MPRPLTDSLDANVARLKEMFGNSADLYAKPVNVRGVPCCLCFFEGLSTLERLWVVMLSMETNRPGSSTDKNNAVYLSSRTALAK